MIFAEPQMLSLGLDEQERKNYFRKKITYNQQMSKIQAKARQEAKLNYCYYCQKEVSSFCNSHSVPQFCLRRIATNGKVYYANTMIGIPFMHSEQGVKEAGTFQLICRDCDSKIFQQYEDPAAYQSKPTGQMLAQIAMKDYLQMIYKRLHEEALYRLMGTELGAPTNFSKKHWLPTAQNRYCTSDLCKFYNSTPTMLLRNMYHSFCHSSFSPRKDFAGLCDNLSEL